MNEVKTYVSFLAVCAILIGILSFLYSPDENAVVGDELGQALESSAITVDEDPKPEIEPPTPDTEEVSSSDSSDESQRKRIHFTQILLRKQKELDLLKDQLSRTTGDTSEIQEKIIRTEAALEGLRDKIKELSNS